MTREDIKHLNETLAMLSSMVRSGESHSIVSERKLEDAFEILLSQQKQVASAKEFLKDLNLPKTVSGEYGECEFMYHENGVIQAMQQFASAVNGVDKKTAKEIWDAGCERIQYEQARRALGVMWEGTPTPKNFEEWYKEFSTKQD